MRVVVVGVYISIEISWFQSINERDYMCDDDDSINIKSHSNELRYKDRARTKDMWTRLFCRRFFLLFIKKFLPSLLPSSSLNSRLKIKGATAVCSLRSFYACFAIFSYNSFDLSLLLLLSCSRSLARRLPRKHIGWSWDEHNKATYKKSFCYLKHAWYAIRLFFLYFPLLYVFFYYIHFSLLDLPSSCSSFLWE